MNGRIKGKYVNRAAVRLRENESFESLLRRFKKIVNREGIILQVKKRGYFVPPSAIRHAKKRKKSRRK